MTRSTARKASECHVLDFFYDDDNGCALTVFVHGARFHIIADAERLKSKSDTHKSIEKKYRKLLSAVRDDVEEDEEPEKVQKRNELDAAEMHDPDANNSDSQDSGHGTQESEDPSEHTDNDEIDNDDNDSAVDVSEGQHDIKEIGVRKNGVVLGERNAPESEKALQNWMLSPFAQKFEELAPASERPSDQTLYEWYHGPTYFFNLEIERGQLFFSQEDESDDLKDRMKNLIPRMPLPKYIKTLDIPMVQAKDVIVLQEGTEPEPYHPVRVKVNGEAQFLKMVDMTQHQPTKREIKLLKEAEEKGLHKKFHIPQVLGLVYEESKSEIMGFLQTDIEDPTPLTKMLDSDVIEDNRTKWAKETERIMSILHEHNIVWGDAKADNFMVDRHGKLWIIDFGGSYTEGWVDPELMETEEGDNMGTEKIINALQDPEANTFQPGEGEKAAEEVQGDELADDQHAPSKKRSRDDSDDDDDGDEEQTSKRRKEA